MSNTVTITANVEEGGNVNTEAIERVTVTSDVIDTTSTSGEVSLGGGTISSNVILMAKAEANVVAGGAGPQGIQGPVGPPGPQGEVGPLSSMNSLNGLIGDVTLSEGTSIQLTQVGQDIEIATDAATEAYVDAKTQVSLVKNEVLGGTINGSNTVFTIVGSALTGSVELYKNGVRQNPGVGNDYTVSGSTITMAVAPLAGTVLLADYATSTSLFTSPTTIGFRTNEAVSGTINGTNKVFTTIAPYMPGTLEIWVNGLKQIPVTHYVETTPNSGIFTFDDAPVSGDNIIVNYSNSLSFAIGDADTVDTFHASPVAAVNSILPLNANAKYPLQVIENPYKFSAYMSATQTLTNAATWYKLNFNTESYDTNNNFDTTTGTYTIPVTGYYQFSVMNLLQAQAGAAFIISLGLTGTTEYIRLEQIPNTTGDITITGTTELYLTAGQTVFVLAYSGTAGKVVYNLFAYSRFSGRFLGV